MINVHITQSPETGVMEDRGAGWGGEVNGPFVDSCAAQPRSALSPHRPKAELGTARAFMLEPTL